LFFLHFRRDEEPTAASRHPLLRKQEPLPVHYFLSGIYLDGKTDVMVPNGYFKHLGAVNIRFYLTDPFHLFSHLATAQITT